MKKNIFQKPIIEIGRLTINVDDLVFINLDNRYYGGVFSEFHLEKLKEIKEMSIVEMVDELKTRGVRISDKIEKLVESNFFNGDPEYKYFRNIRDRIVMIKGTATSVRAPRSIIGWGLPDGFHLVPVKITFGLAYLISFIFTKEFLNLHNIDRVFIMSDPLEKLSDDDDNLIVVWNPTYNNIIEAGLYNNPYSGDRNAGYLFFY